MGATLPQAEPTQLQHPHLLPRPVVILRVAGAGSSFLPVRPCCCQPAPAPCPFPAPRAAAGVNGRALERSRRPSRPAPLFIKAMDREKRFSIRSTEPQFRGIPLGWRCPPASRSWHPAEGRGKGGGQGGQQTGTRRPPWKAQAWHNAHPERLQRPCGCPLLGRRAAGLHPLICALCLPQRSVVAGQVLPSSSCPLLIRAQDSRAWARRSGQARPGSLGQAGPGRLPAHLGIARPALLALARLEALVDVLALLPLEVVLQAARSRVLSPLRSIAGCCARAALADRPLGPLVRRPGAAATAGRLS